MSWLAYLGPLPGAPALDLSAAAAQHLHLPLPPQLALALHSVRPDAGLLATAAYCLFYTALDPFAGITWSLFVGAPLWLGAQALNASLPAAWAVTVPLHLISWFMQIVPGHAIIEKRKPALLDSLVQVVVVVRLAYG